MSVENPAWCQSAHKASTICVHCDIALSSARTGGNLVDKEYKKFLQGELRNLPQRTPEEKAARKKFATQCGHVSRRLYRDERLTGELLELAVSACFEDMTAEKLRKGEPLTDYEKHLIVDVALLHMRLA
jgi:hypothetical protein